ncbi:MAG: prepilin-type N-terminal cleavage/methylation domain-containing protein [Eubacteriales bacterium]|nr:prepilin-type N-terminal cleavage/methylation domain-containing protein [Eubacteriales bacterium]
MRKVLKRLKLNKKGFTFAECIVAIALFAIVGTLAFTMFNTATRYMSKAKKEEAKRSQAQEQALLNTFKYKEGDEVKGYIIYPSRVLQVSYISTSKGNVPQYSVVLNYNTDYGSVPFAVAVEKNGTPKTQYTYNITRYQVTSDKGTKRILFVYDDDIDYDLNNPEEVKSNVLTLDEVDRYFKD